MQNSLMTRGDRIDNLPIDRIFTYGTTATARQIQMQSFDVISNFGTLRYRSGGTARHHANSNIPSKFRFCILGVNFIVCRRSLLLLLLQYKMLKAVSSRFACSSPWTVGNEIAVCSS